MNDCIEWWRHSPKSCTPEELNQILCAQSNGEYVLPTDSYNKVFEGIYIGDESIARNRDLLKFLNISHVLNAAFGKDMALNLIDISSDFYSEYEIQFLGIEALDMAAFNLYQYFEKSAQFIEQCLVQRGNVLVHCKEGISRSATIVCAFLMINKGFSAPEAIRTVRKHREIRPNYGFLFQLSYLNDRLTYKQCITGPGRPKNLSK